MERRGVSVDMEQLKSMERVLETKMKAAEQECHKAAGKQFQVNSPLQVRALLYDELKLDEKCNVKISATLSKGAKSTSEATLRSLMSVHPLPKWILEYRRLHKAHATFLTGIAQHVKDGVVKPTWVQTAAATGRIASNNPNLQAIPKAPFNVIMFPESEDVDNPLLNFRSVYTARAGHALLAADFRHVECRVFAHAAADSALLAALASDQDLFKVLAAKCPRRRCRALTASAPSASCTPACTARARASLWRSSTSATISRWPSLLASTGRSRRCGLSGSAWSHRPGTRAGGCGRWAGARVTCRDWPARILPRARTLKGRLLTSSCKAPQPTCARWRWWRRARGSAAPRTCCCRYTTSSSGRCTRTTWRELLR
ncbi:DNA polymerase nu-like isoform X3 [Ostrinia furnacalis]|uniref:DNA polymerase nu-like isoform X3 n=1 Tax=Ostrinia furnacalis TaxID=93504 RepID=UPI001040654D|nr:DNA polymerase nu-like isoform X3 [Ostrinia furnacalis]